MEGRVSRRSVRMGALAALAASLFVALGAGRAAVRAQDPPLPDFAYRYGRVSPAANLDLQPAIGPSVALVQGRACGEGVTLVAPTGSGEDTGHTVYTLRIESNAAVPGCGQPGQPFTIWFPAARRMAEAAGPWFTGSARMDVVAARELPFALAVPSVARD